MKILIIGASGVIGSKIKNSFLEDKCNITSTYYSHKLNINNEYQLDIRDFNDVEKIFLKVQPDIVIHTSAITDIDLCEKDHQLADSINILGTENIIRCSKKINSKLVYVSTSFVFDGSRKKYFENDETNSTTYYGKTKEISEKRIIDSVSDYLILRTDQPYCWIEPWQHSNSVLRVINRLKDKQIHKEIIDWYNTPTYVTNFVDVTKKLIINKKSGIYHVVGSDYINRFDWSMKICNYFNLNPELIIPIRSEDLKLTAKRVNVNLSNKKIFNELGIEMMGVDDGLKAMLTDKNQEKNEQKE